MARYSCHICGGPTRRQLFRGLEQYQNLFPVEFKISEIKDFHSELTCYLYVKIFVRSIEVLLMPWVKGEGPMTINMVKNTWQIKGFVETRTGYKPISLVYNTKDRDGTLYFDNESP